MTWRTVFAVLRRSISVSASSTNWDNVSAYARIYKITTTASAVETVQDHRVGKYGIFGAERPTLWNQQTDNYTLALTDAENAVAMNKASAVNLTVPPNSSVAFPVGAAVLVYAEGAGDVTVLSGSGVTIRVPIAGSPNTPVLSQYRMATLVKRGSDEWIVSGQLS